MGGGTGLSVLLRGLKKHALDLTAVVTVADDGGSSGRLRSELNILPPGDIRNVLVALARTEPLLEEVLQYRFAHGEGLAGHTLGNLMLAALSDITGDFVQGIKELSRVLAVQGKVLPVSGKAVILKAVMEDGSQVVGESKIPLSGKRIQRLELYPPDVPPNREVLEAIAEADAVVVGPGSLYTSVLPNLLVRDVAEAIHRSRALKVYICNVMTQPGETDGFSASDHLRVIQQHVGRPLFDTVIIHQGDLPAEILEQYAEQNAQPVVADTEALEKMGYQIVADDLVVYQTYLRHNAEKLSKWIDSLVRQRMPGGSQKG